MKLLLKSSALWSAIAVLFNTVMNLCIIPIVSNRIGIEAYGFVTLANTMITYIDIISLAINSFASRYVAVEYHKGKIESAKIYYSSVFIANVLLSIIILAVMLVSVPNIQHFIKITKTLENDVKLLFFTVFIRYVFVLLRSTFEIPAFIKNKIYLTEQIRTLSYIIQTLILLVTCVILPARVWYVGVASAVAALFMLLAEITIAKRTTPNLYISVSNFSGKSLIKVISSGIWNSINNIGNQLNSGLDLLITNKMLTELALGLISVSKTFGSMCYILANSVGNALKPKQLEYYSRNDIKALVYEFKKAMRITGVVCSIIIAGFYACGEDFLSLWIHTGNIDEIFRLSMIVLFGDIITGVVNPLFYAYTLSNKIKVPCIITLILGFLNVLGMYVLISQTNLGIYAVVLTTVVLNMVHFIDTPLYSCYCLNLKYGTFYPTVFRHLFNTAVLLVLMRLMRNISFYADTWMKLGLKIIVCGVIEILISIVIMTTKNEKIYILKKFNQRAIRLKNSSGMWRKK